MRLPSLFSLKTTALAAAAAFLVGAGSGSWITNELAQAKANRLELAQQKAYDKAVDAARKAERTQAEKDFTAEKSALQRQRQTTTRYVKLTKEVPVYVTEIQDRACVPYGIVRVLDAAALGSDPAALELPAGQSDDACSPLKPSDLARGILHNYEVAQQNAQQLDALIASVVERTDAFNRP